MYYEYKIVYVQYIYINLLYIFVVHIIYLGIYTLNTNNYNNKYSFKTIYYL